MPFNRSSNPASDSWEPEAADSRLAHTAGR